MVRPPRDPLTDQDRAAWTAYVGQIRPLAGRAAPPPRPQPAAVPAVPPPLPAAPEPRRPRQRADAALVIGRAPAGLDKATWRRFSAGQMAVGRRLDLHGHTAQRARDRFEQVLAAAAAHGLRCLEVITGRGSETGGGVLWREFPLWLNLPQLRPLILAACHPHPNNTGAVLLLLRRTIDRAGGRQ